MTSFEATLNLPAEPSESIGSNSVISIGSNSVISVLMSSPETSMSSRCRTLSQVQATHGGLAPPSRPKPVKSPRLADLTRLDKEIGLLENLFKAREVEAYQAAKQTFAEKQVQKQAPQSESAQAPAAAAAPEKSTALLPPKADKARKSWEKVRTFVQSKRPAHLRFRDFAKRSGKTVKPRKQRKPRKLRSVGDGADKDDVSDWRSLSRQNSREATPEPSSFTITRKAEKIITRRPALPKSKSAPPPEVSDHSEPSLRRYNTVDVTIGLDNLTNQEKVVRQPGRCKLCRHYLRGECTLGNDCTFLHDISVLKPDEQKVFIGGIPRNCPPDLVVSSLLEQGFKAINIPKCHPCGFAPKVCIDSVANAKKLLKMARIRIGDKIADVRRFNDSRGNGRDLRSVFVLGLPDGITSKRLMDDMTKQGFVVEREPIIEKGASYCQRVELQTLEMVDALLVLEKIPVGGKHITIKKYEGGKRSKTFSKTRRSPKSRGSRAKRSPKAEPKATTATADDGWTTVSRK